MNANKIIKVLHDFNNSNYNKIMINGSWGIGKTKYTLDFAENHGNTYYISLFGKKDIDSIFQEIYFRIVEKAPNRKTKKMIGKVLEKFNHIDVSFYGVSLSIPLIENIYKKVSKELDNKNSCIIIFDDLERKHIDLDIREILGLVDTFSKIEKVKIILIASLENLEENDSIIFKAYKEKSIDRVYTIKEYAKEAPKEIMGNYSWNVLKTIVQEYSFTNLRTFEKTKLFIEEVCKSIGEDIYTDKFTKSDLIKICFAIVFFKVEHNNEMRLLDEKDIIGKHLTSNPSEVIYYLYHYVLKNSLNNYMAQNLIIPIMVWFETGEYCKERIENEINLINNYDEKPYNFFSSEEEILQILKSSAESLKNLTGDENLVNIIIQLSITFGWCRAFNIDFEFSDEDILNLLHVNIYKHVDLDKTIYENKIDTWDISIEGDRISNLVNLINIVIEKEFMKKILIVIEEKFNEQMYIEHEIIDRINDSISQLNNDSNLKVYISDKIKEKKYFFPIPSGKIREETWFWCRKINMLIKNIENCYEIKDYYKEFQIFLGNISNNYKDKMLIHRLKNLS